MRITEILEQPVGLHGNPANAVVNFTNHTVSLVVVLTDVIRGGRPVVGAAFDSIGRFAQSGVLRDRMKPSALLDHEAHRVSEIDIINGAVPRQGARVGVAAPVNATLTAVIKSVERRWSAGESD
jgi:ketopantoate reductase